MEQFLVQHNKKVDSTIGVTPLGDSNPEILESSMTANFNNYSYAVTITLKGSHKFRALEDDLIAQYNLIKNLIKLYINDHTKSYIFYIEKHKCGSWIHTHGIIEPLLKKSIKEIKQKVYQHIEGHELKKGMSYKTRIFIEKPYDMINWWNYCKKEEELWNSCSEIKKLFKLKSIKPTSFEVTFE